MKILTGMLNNVYIIRYCLSEDIDKATEQLLCITDGLGEDVDRDVEQPLCI